MLFRFDDFDRTFDLMNRLQRRLDQAMTGYGPDARPGAAGLGHVDLHETDDALHVTVDLPGVTEDDLEITLKNEVLTLSGKRAVDAPEGYRAHLRERRPFTFTRSFSLPSPVDPEKAKATLEDGVLHLRLGKAEAARPRQIAVTAG